MEKNTCFSLVVDVVGVVVVVGGGVLVVICVSSLMGRGEAECGSDRGVIVECDCEDGEAGFQ